MEFRPFRFAMNWTLRLLLAAVFMYAAAGKISNPQAFADIITNYQLFPDGSVSAIALFLPWLEAVCAVLLVVGRWTDGSLLILNGLLLVFITALSVNWYRGVDVACGCFTTAGDGGSNYLWDILRDLALLAAGLWLALQRMRLAPRPDSA
jgi:uncharacterized membrane protein YphA (DoxX/SURF4 family)